MPVYLSILRGINVSGKNKIKMEALKAMYKSLGFNNITTYIQSGNVVFESKPSINLAQEIEKKIADTFQFNVPVIIRTKEEINKVNAQNPFLNQVNIEADKLHVTYLSQLPSKESISTISTFNFSPDEFIIVGKEVYVYCPNGYGKTKLNNTFFEKKLKVQATTRNWKSTSKLGEIVSTYS